MIASNLLLILVVLVTAEDKDEYIFEIILLKTDRINETSI